MEFQAHALCHEDCWFTALTLRSSQVALMAGGMAAVFSTLIKTCFVDNSLSDVGLVLNRDGRPPTRVFARLDCFVQDGAAHKNTWHCKGDAGSKICILCQNLFSAKSELCDEDDVKCLCRGDKRLGGATCGGCGPSHSLPFPVACSSD